MQLIYTGAQIEQLVLQNQRMKTLLLDAAVLFEDYWRTGQPWHRQITVDTAGSIARDIRKELNDGK